MAIEDFATYSESGTTVSENGTRCTATNIVEGDTDERIWYDKGAAHFAATGIEHLGECYYDAAAADLAGFSFYGLTNSVANPYGATNYVTGAFFAWNPSYYAGIYGGGGGDNDALSLDTLYYYTITITGASCSMVIYSDASRETEVFTVTDTCDNTTRRYVFGIGSIDYDGGGYAASGYSQNLDLQEAAGTTLPVDDDGRISEYSKMKQVSKVGVYG
jgi:hypothetical protein